MDYRQAIDYLLGFADFERSGRFRDRPDVEPVRSLLRRLGDPHLGRITVHIAGSKGKGSIAAMVESILRQAGLSTGLFTSPHLHSYCERIRINGEAISEQEFARLVQELRPAVEAEKAAHTDRELVTFDLLTALAFLAFGKHALQCQIIEVGLGGRLDSTNVFAQKEVCVIAPISREHTAILGETVAEIAREKAAIIRPRATVVMAPQAYREATAVICEAAAKAEGKLVDVAGCYSWQRLAGDLRGQRFALRAPTAVGERKLWLPLLGQHQLENAATAVAAVEALSLDAIGAASEEVLRAGLAAVRWPGRLEVLRRRPLVVADTAHNRDSARRLREALTDYLSCERAFLIVGTLADKDIQGMAEELSPIADRVLAVAGDHPRAMPPAKVAAAFAAAGCPVEAGEAETARGASGALEAALARSGPKGVICVVGASAVVAEARECLLGPAYRRSTA